MSKQLSPDETILDPEEQAIEDALERGEYVRIPNMASEIKRVQEIAEYSQKLRKDQTITLRISGKTLNDLKVLAARKNLGYQTYIGSILHEHTQEKLHS